MKRSIVTTFFACLAAAAFAQDKFDFLSHQNFTALSAGRYEADFAGLNSQLSQWGAAKSFPVEYYMVGASFGTGDGSTRNKKWDASTSLEFMLPQEVSIGANDSLVFRMKGWHFMTSAFGKDVIPGNMVALVLAPGIDWGTTKIRRKVAGGEGNYKNPFISPLARADLRFVFGPVVIGARALYRYDLTNSIWKRRTDGLPVLPGSRMTGLGLQAFIGWGRIE